MAPGTQDERAPRRPFCAAVSRASEESIAATASRIDNWVLIEYRGAWRRDVLGGSLLSPRLKAHLRAQLETLRPATLAQAGRMEGMTPAALMLLLAHLRKAPARKLA